MSEKVQFIFLDLDDTLYPYAICNDFATEQLIEQIQLETHLDRNLIKISYQESRKEVNNRLYGQGSSHNRLLYIQGLCERLGIPIFPNALNWDLFFWKAYFTKMQLREGVLDFLKFARDLQIKVCIITDLVANIQFQKISALGLGSYIDAIVTSEEAGVEKPNSSIFLFALKKIKANPELSLMIGDNLEKDVIGARRVGMNAILFGSHESEEKFILSFREAAGLLN